MFISGRIKSGPAAVFLILLFCCAAANTSEAAAKAQKTKKVKYVKSKYGLKALIELSKARAAMIKELEGDTKNYDKVKNAVSRNALDKGESCEKIRKTYGEPVIILRKRKEVLG